MYLRQKKSSTTQEVLVVGCGTERILFVQTASAGRVNPADFVSFVAQEWRIEMKEVLLAFVSVVSLIAFVLISVTFIETTIRVDSNKL